MSEEQKEPLLKNRTRHSPRSPVLLDVEKAETANICHIEQQQQQKPQRQLLRRESSDSFSLLYDKFQSDESTPNVMSPSLSLQPLRGGVQSSSVNTSGNDRIGPLNLKRSASARPSQSSNFQSSMGGGGQGQTSNPSMRDVVRRVQLARSSSVRRVHAPHHRRLSSASAADILQAIGGDRDDSADTHPPVGEAFQRTAPLFSDVFQEEGTEDDVEVEEHPKISVSAPAPASTEPFYGSLQMNESNESLSPANHDFRTTLHRRHLQHHRSQRLRTLQQFCSPLNLIRTVCESLRRAWIWAAVPFAAAAWLLYYALGNPGLDFLPGPTRLSWWCNFCARQITTLELARVTSLLLCELVMTRSGVRLLGSYLSFFCLQASGWPFLVTWWGIWDLLLLHGDNTFQSHWLYWTGWNIYSVANSGKYILSSHLYLRLLLSMIILGMATAVKRMMLAIRFGNEQLAEFKPKLEKILQDAVIVSEVALIAQEAAALSGEASPPKDMSSLRGTLLPRVRFESVTFTDGVDEVAANEGAFESSHTSRESAAQPSAELHVSEMNAASGLEEVHYSADPPSTNRTPDHRPSLARTKSGNFRIKEKLERWEEPPKHSVKTVNGSIHDVLKFQRVLHSIDATYPFGEEFGPCATRHDCIESAHEIYWNLMLISPSASALPFEAITLGAVLDEEGNIDEAKYNAFHRVFRPDASNELPLTYFIQSIDSVFKSILFFRASVRNSSVIDNVLERIINVFFYFVMLLLLLSFMHLDPWPLLVSLTSLLVSVSFALGSSVSKYVEGLSLIAFRRPFDLGDRIVILPPEAVDNPNPLASWFVEGINLFSTTLRAARTNEVATVSNSSIAGARIVNLNRSPRAIVLIEARTKICVLDGDKLTDFVEALEKYVSDHPRIWEALLYCRKETVDTDLEQVVFTLGFRHRNSWQDAARIMLSRGDLVAYVYKVAKDTGISYDSPPSRSLLYGGGVLLHGQVQDYKSNLLNPLNIRSHTTSENPHLRESSFDMQAPLQG